MIWILKVRVGTFVWCERKFNLLPDSSSKVIVKLNRSHTFFVVNKIGK